MLGDDAIISSDFGGNPPYEKMKEVARICFKHWLKQANVLFIIGGKSNNTDIFETFRAMADALREHFSKHGPTPLYVVIGRGGPNLVRGMGAMRDTLRCARPALPHLRLRLRHERSHPVRPARGRMDEGRRARADRRPDRRARIERRRDNRSGSGLRRSTCTSKASGDFKYFVGISSLAQVATREDRVCVLNILGGESQRRHAGRARVFGRQRRVRHVARRRGQVLETPIGNVPVYNNVLEGLNDGHRFNCGVIYLPPSAARDGVAELIRVNPDLQKIFIVTEKLAVHDSREIRAMGQPNGIDIFGGNSLGVADAWNQVRIGGALGGDNPDEALRKGSIAIFSNSGNFTTTIATYLRMAAGARRRSISSGKDVYIHFAAPEFAFALANDARSKAAVLYVRAGRLLRSSTPTSRKPVVACVVGRWKSQADAGCRARRRDGRRRRRCRAKERWFMEKFGVDRPLHAGRPRAARPRARVVTNIAHIPAALTRGDARERDAARTSSPKAASRSSRGSARTRASTLPASTRPAGGRGASRPTTNRSRRSTAQIGAVAAAPDDEGRLGRLADGREDAGHAACTAYRCSTRRQYPLEANVSLALLHEPGGENDAEARSTSRSARIVNLHGDA